MCLCLLVLVVVISPSTAFATLDTRDYIPAPAGTTAFVFYYDHLSGTNLYSQGTLANKDTDTTVDTTVWRIAHWGQTGRFPWIANLIMPLGEVSLDGAGVGNAETSYSSYGDPIISVAFWPYSNPSAKTWFGVGLYITIPAGEYDNSKALGLNLAQNRWAFEPELAFVKGFGNFFLDLSGSVAFFTDNDKYTEADLTLEKDPLFKGEVHLTYDFTEKLFGGVEYFYANGGETSVGGAGNNDETKSHTAGVVVGMGLTDNTQLLIKYRNVLKTDNGVKTKNIGIRFAYFF